MSCFFFFENRIIVSQLKDMNPQGMSDVRPVYPLRHPRIERFTPDLISMSGLYSNLLNSRNDRLKTTLKF